MEINKNLKCPREAKPKRVTEVVVIPKSKHGVSKKQINQHALQIIRTLKEHGFQAYIVGGGIRDLLLKRKPKDFDIATDARPQALKKLFRNCRLIGRRFRLAHIFFGREIIEVATFRAGHETGEPHEARTRDGLIVRDNVYGTIDQDAWRRDFTINAIYYDVEEGALLDFVDGYRDLKHRILHVIGDPNVRYCEDPVRMLRAARFAGKLGFELEQETETAIFKSNHLLQNISSSRLYDEVVKVFHSGESIKIFPFLERYGLFDQLFPLTAQYFKENAAAKMMMIDMLRNTDERIVKDKGVAAHFLFAVFLWYPFLRLWQTLCDDGFTKMLALHKAASNILKEQSNYTKMPRRIVAGVQDIWSLQPYLEERRPRQVYRTLEDRRFRAAYDLLLLRAKLDKSLVYAADWWTKLQAVNRKAREKMIAEL